MEYTTYRINARETSCYIFEGGIITADESGLISLIDSD
jgi:hypothetical protein